MSKNFLKFPLIILFLLNFHSIYAQNYKPQLFEVKKIYIERTESAKYGKFYDDLTTELRRKLVFTVVPTIEEADSILKIEFLVELWIHSEEPDNPVFSCKLFTKKEELIWKKDIVITTKGDTEMDNKLAAQRIADKLVKDWVISDRKRRKRSS